jgi:hypothetical protein
VKKEFTGKLGLKAGDFLILVLGAALVVFLFVRYLYSAPAGKWVEVSTASGKESFEIGVDRRVTLSGPVGNTTVVIKNGEVWAEDSDCRDKVCVKMGKKRRAGEQIVCLPNRVVIEVAGEQLEFDAISR